jgi:hypothetical protein
MHFSQTSILIFDFTVFSEEARQSDWDGIIACHQGKRSCSTWNYQRSTIGAYFLKPRGVKTNSNLTATVSDLVDYGMFSLKYPTRAGRGGARL